MAKRKVNKSAAIRDYVIAHPGASAKQIVSAMAKKKITVNANMVGNVKSKAGLTKKHGKVRRKSVVRSNARSSSNGHASMELLGALVDAKKLVAKAGSVENAIAMLKTIKTLDSIV